MKRALRARVAADLEAAAVVLETDGWTQELLVDDKGARCLMGALDKVYGPDKRNAEIALRTTGARDSDEMQGVLDREDFAYAMVKKQVGVKSFLQWNDDPSRTAGQVIEALRSASARCKP